MSAVSAAATSLVSPAFSLLLFFPEVIRFGSGHTSSTVVPPSLCADPMEAVVAHHCRTFLEANLKNPEENFRYGLRSTVAASSINLRR